MQLASLSKKFSGALVAIAMCTSSTGAIASTHSSQPVSLSPFVALSALASDASRTALCGAAAAAAAGAAALAQGAKQGCVLPVVDQTTQVPVAEALPPPPVPPPPVAPIAGEGLGISPLLLALVAVAAGVGLYFLLHKKKAASPA